ncbi:MAG: ABC transporter permease [Caldilineaceae bacterium]
MPLYLAVKEVLQNKGRFLLICLIVALITTLVLFIAALAEGLAAANKEYIENLTGELIVFQENVELSFPSSRIGRSTVGEIRRVEGVADVGQISFASGALVFDQVSPEGVTLPTTTTPQPPLDVTLVGVEPGRPGEPAVVSGSSLGRSRSDGVIIDDNVALRRNITLGDTITIKTTQGTSEEFYKLVVVGIADKLQFQFLPSIFIPYTTWEKVRPKAANSVENDELVSNVAVVKLVDPAQWRPMVQRLEQQVDKVEVVDRETAYKSSPGYAAQQSTLDTQRYFTLFIGILVIGGFFQIQTLQKVAQIGMLKAIGASNMVVIISAIAQIILVNCIGVLIGALGSYLLQLSFPVEIPVIFTGRSVATAIISLLLIGPVSGLVSLRSLLKVEPLTALGLAQ